MSITPHILIATPVAGGVVSHDFMHGMNALRSHIDSLGWKADFISQPDGLVTRSRNAFASLVLRTDKYTHLLMIDADVIVDPKGVERIVRSGHDVVGCSVPLRNINWDRLGEHLLGHPGSTAEELRAIATDYAVWFEPGQKVVDGFVSVRAIGSAVMLISKAALAHISQSGLVQFAERGLHTADLQESGWTFFDTYVDSDGNYLSEDYALCDRWRKLGGHVWADLISSTRHIGPVTILGDISTSLSAAQALEINK
jgi:hypothetical protein